MLDEATENFRRKAAESAEAAKPPEPEPVDLGPEWEALKQRWKAA